MDDPATVEKLLDERLRTVQIVVGALVASVLMFVGVQLFMQFNNQAPQNGQGPMLTYLAFGMFAGAVVVWSIFPNRFADMQVAKIAAGTWNPPSGSATPPAIYTTDIGKLFAVFATKCIIAGALLEGPAFLGGVAYMVARNAAPLAVIAGAVLLLLVTFPTRQRAKQWLERQQQYIDETRQFGQSSES